MKKINAYVATFLASIVLSGCGMGTGGSTIATGTGSGTTNTINAGSASLNTLTSVLGSNGSTVLGTLMSTLLGNKTSQNSIVGNWVYSKPKVAFESENILAQLGSAVASSKLESTLDSQLKKIGFTAGKSSFTFQNDGSCTLSLSNRSLPGTYTYNSKTGQMTIKGALGVTSISPYVSVMGNEMYVMFDADKLLSVMGAVSSVAKTNVLSSLISNYNGVKLGWTFTRQ